MKKLFFIAFAILLTLNVQAQTKIKVDKIPTSVDDFLLLREKIGKTPEGGAVAFVVATMMYSQNPTLGRQAIIIQSDKNLLSPSESGYKGFDLSGSSSFLVKQLDQKKHIPNSYVSGTSNADGYALKAAPYTFEISMNNYSKMEDGKIKVFVACTGADSPRPVTLKQNDKGTWKAFEYSSLFVGVKAPVVKSKGGDF